MSASGREAGVQSYESRPDWRDCVLRQAQDMVSLSNHVAKVYPVEFPTGNPIQQGKCPFYPPLGESGEICSTGNLNTCSKRKPVRPLVKQAWVYGEAALAV